MPPPVRNVRGRVHQPILWCETRHVVPPGRQKPAAWPSLRLSLAPIHVPFRASRAMAW